MVSNGKQSGTYIELDEDWNDPGWTRVPNSIARCNTISRRLKGWILEVASHEPGRRLTFADMLGTSTDGRDATYSTIKEGVDAGFITRYRDRDDSGRLGIVVYRVHVRQRNPRSEPLTPYPEVDDPRTAEPLTAKPDLVEPDVVKPETSKKTRSSLEDYKPREDQKHMVTADASTDREDPDWEPDLFSGTPPSSRPGVSPRRSKAELDELWQEFWQVYPRKVAKIKAKTAWTKAVKIHDPREIINGAARYAQQQSRPDLKPYTKHPATWLNDGCWDDEPALPPLSTVSGHGKNGYSPYQNPSDPSAYEGPLR